MNATSQSQGTVDVNTFVGPFPFRHVPHPSAAALVGVMQREGISRALVGWLPAPWHRSTGDANRELLRELQPHAGVLIPAPCINPGWPGWKRDLDAFRPEDAPAIRVYPPQWAAGTSATELRELAVECAQRNQALILTTRFEDARQRHWMDSAPDLSAAVVRDMARCHPGVRIILTAAGRSLIEEIHWSLTPEERMRVWYDYSWVWGPPQNDFAHLLASVGADRFLFGSMWPLRLAQAPIANLALLPPGAPAPAASNYRAALPALR